MFVRTTRSTLQALNLIRYYEGQHIIDISNLPERLKTPREFKVVVDPSKLHWTPLHTAKKGGGRS